MTRLLLTLSPALLICGAACFTLAEARPPAQAHRSPFGEAIRELTPPPTSGAIQPWLDGLPNFRFSPATARLLTQEFGSARLFSVTRSSTVAGVRDYAIMAPARAHANRQGARYAWSAMQASVAVQESDGTITSDGKAEMFSMKDKAGHLTIRDLAFSSSGRRGDSGLFNGDLAGALGKVTLTLKEKDATTATLDKLYVKVGITEQPDTLGMRYEAGAGAVNLGDLKIDDIKIAAHIDKMDKASIRTFRGLAAALSNNTPLAAQSALVEPLWRDLVSALASKGAVVELDTMQFSYKGNVAQMRGHYRFENVTPEDFDKPDVLQKKVVAHVEARIPLAMVHAISAQLGGNRTKMPRADAATMDEVNRRFVADTLKGPIAAGMVRIDGDMLVSTVDMRDGVVLINGKPMTPPPVDDEPVAAVDNRGGRGRPELVANSAAPGLAAP